ncbi:uncharacterized protein LOC122035919 [Zingiber officinale]|uniref:uncharacterized protein LOC122035919 n=1 Tax=Zingiber officinale TaxID=94328 RepID=UPI001C4D4F4F|nr:uncharacterized protein LOC122035919 [Zingiber officinale]
MTEAGPVTWQQFKELFLKQYYPTEFSLQKLSEFENFTQASSMFMVEYTSKFNSLGTYNPTIMVDDTLKLHHFKKDLSSRIQSVLIVYKLTNFTDLMGVAIRAETDIKRREDKGKNKRPLTSQSFPIKQRLKRPNLLSGPSKGPSFTSSSQGVKSCPTFNFRHLEECCRIFGAYFNCGKMGHRIADYPKPKKQGTGSNSIAAHNKLKENKPNARVFAMTQKEAEDASDVVAGTILINKMIAYVLFDCGATHSFISKRFTKKLGLRAEVLNEPYRVAMPTNKVIQTHKLHRSCQVSIGNHTFKADLIQLNMVEFRCHSWNGLVGQEPRISGFPPEECQTSGFKPRRNYLPWQGQEKETTPVRISDLESHEER